MTFQWTPNVNGLVDQKVFECHLLQSDVDIRNDCFKEVMIQHKAITCLESFSRLKVCSTFLGEACVMLETRNRGIFRK